MAHARQDYCETCREEAARQGIAGHLSKKMPDRYSHVRMAAKRSAVEALGGELIVPEPDVHQAKGEAN